MWIGKKIPRRCRNCVQCNQAFESNAEIYSFAYTDDEELLRKDYCLTCWNTLNTDEIEMLGYWKTEKEEKVDVPKTPDQAAFHFFKEVVESDLESDQKMAYFLANYLKRCKQLQQKRFFNSPEHPNTDLFEEPESSEVFLIKRYHYSKDELFSIKEKLEAKLMEIEEENSTSEEEISNQMYP